MKQPLKQVHFYKRGLAAGCAQGFAMDDELCLHLAQGGGAWFAAFDTHDTQGTFNRLVVDGDFDGAKLEVLAAAAPSDGEDGQSLSAYLHSDAPAAEKMAALTALGHVRAVDEQDILLHSLEGRWVYLCVAVTAQGAEGCVLRGVRLEFPRYSFTQYFPEIYQDNDFFRRYIAVFQSLYLDLEAKVDDVPRMLDYESASPQGLEALASWLGVDTAGSIFNDEQLCILIRGSRLFQGGKGTRNALVSVVQLACGVRPRIVEHFQWDKLPMPAARRQLYERLYGADSSTFCVILDLTDHPGPLDVTQAQLEKLIEAYSMLGTRHKLVLLRPCSYTDTHCYLDVNSCLSTPERAAVDGVTLGGYFTVG